MLLIVMGLPVVMAAPKVKPRDLTLDLRQGVARTTLHRDGQIYQAAKVWLLDAGRPSLAALAGGDLAVARVTSEKLWSGNLVELSRLFRTSRVQLGLPATHFTPAVIRAGGAA